MTITLNLDLLEAMIFHGLKSLLTPGDTLPPRFLEMAICDSFGFKHVGDSAFYADGIKDECQMSIKTRTLKPDDLKTKESRDFQTHKNKFLGPQINKKHNRIINGIEIVQRRQQLNLKNDSTADPSLIGKETIKGFLNNINESKNKFSVTKTYEVIAIHGYDTSKEFYLLSLFWKEIDLEDYCLDIDTVYWQREGYGVSGYIDRDGKSKKIYERINGNAKREATCFKEYKDLTIYQNTVQLKVPIPNPWTFNMIQISNEIAEIKNRISKSIVV